MSLPTEPPFDCAQLIRLDRQRLLNLLAERAPEDWAQPTPCPGWTVLDLVNHLVGADLSVVAWNRDGHRGTPAPSGIDESGFIAWLDELQIEWVHAARRISAELAGGLLAWLIEPLADTMLEQDASAVEARVSWASDRLVPRWMDHARELTERWIHRQQLLEAVGLPSDLTADIAGPVLDSLRWAYPYRLSRGAPNAESSVAINVTGPFSRRWDLAHMGDRWEFVDGVGTSHAASLSMSVEQAWRLLTNNYRQAEHGPLTAEGDADLLEILLQTRAIIGAPL